jgi:HSP90 family molecular chaperone
MSQWNPLKLNMLNNIRNFVEMYPYPPVEAALVEAVANCLDAKATNIAISAFKDSEGKDILKVEDNGKGMTKEEFEEHYHALSVSSKVKGEGIGFAGVGSKLYVIFLAAGGNILTETRSDNFHDSSEIIVINGEPKWRHIERRQLNHNGTIYELKLTEEDATFLTNQKITEVLQTHYNAILLGRYGNITIYLNSEQVKPWRPEIDETRSQVGHFKLHRKDYKCFFEFSKTDLGER